MDVPVPHPALDSIRILGEGDTHQICIITLEPEDITAGGMDGAQLKALICLHPAVQAVFPGLAPAGVTLTRHPQRTLIRDEARVAAGQTVHLHGNKGATVAAPAPEPEGTPLYYAARDAYLVVGPGERPSEVLRRAGLNPACMRIVKRYGQFVVEEREGVPDIQNDNNTVTAAAAESVVYYAPTNRYVTVPRSEKLALYACAVLGLDATRHWVSRYRDHYILKGATVTETGLPAGIPARVLDGREAAVTVGTRADAHGPHDCAFIHMPSGQLSLYRPRDCIHGDAAADVVAAVRPDDVADYALYERGMPVFAERVEVGQSYALRARRK